jgi:hypothetical protein
MMKWQRPLELTNKIGCSPLGMVFTSAAASCSGQDIIGSEPQDETLSSDS